jgi:hypothetical protein
MMKNFLLFSLLIINSCAFGVRVLGETRTLKTYDSADGTKRAVCFTEGSDKRVLVVSLNGEGTLIANRPVFGNVEDITFGGNGIFVYRSNSGLNFTFIEFDHETS